MIFQRINRTSPEKVFVIVRNSWTTAALTNGQAVQWDFGTDLDGVGVTRPTARATNAGLAAAGIVAEGIASGEYGLIQVYGYHSAVRIRRKTGGPDVAAGRPLALSSGGGIFALCSFSTAAASVDHFPCAFALSANTTVTTAAGAAFIKAL